MFNVTRPATAPACIAKKQYNKQEVIDELLPMFYEKCYLCERDNLHDAEVEHFVPHKKVAAIKYNWNNLFYACSRCNSVKGSTHINLLDCTDNTIDVGALISCLAPSSPSGEVTVEATATKPTLETENTVKLLHECYNLENTGLRGISRESLMEQIWEHYSDLVFNRLTLMKKNSPASRKQEAVESMEAMLNVNYPFSILWRNYYLNDKPLKRKYPQLQVGF